MPRIKLFLICFISTFFGILLFAFQQEWIVVRMPQFGNTSAGIIKHKKAVTLHFWHENRWHTENQELLWSNNTADNIFYLVTNWLNTLDAEEVTQKKVVLQAATLSPSGTDAYLSFDRNPLQKEWSTYQKWMWIEGLLKTIRERQLPVQNIYLLVHHQPLIDRHIDGTHAWPLSSFLLLNENRLQ